jgi:hypothetical protein
VGSCIEGCAQVSCFMARLHPSSQLLPHTHDDRAKPHVREAITAALRSREQHRRPRVIRNIHFWRAGLVRRTSHHLHSSRLRLSPLHSQAQTPSAEPRRQFGLALSRSFRNSSTDFCPPVKASPPSSSYNKSSHRSIASYPVSCCFHLSERHLPHTHSQYDVLKIITGCRLPPTALAHYPDTDVLTVFAACNLRSMARTRHEGAHGLQVRPRLR